ncbi:hypothetical protein ASF12_22740 [Paenibacillus sp. Leaf72]|nr:hypothetical protein ASF12_22740 [Paenibacillus sp. Leaf72]
MYVLNYKNDTGIIVLKTNFDEIFNFRLKFLYFTVNSKNPPCWTKEDSADWHEYEICISIIYRRYVNFNIMQNRKALNSCLEQDDLISMIHSWIGIRVPTKKKMARCYSI